MGHKEQVSRHSYEIIDCHFHPAVDEKTDFSWFYPAGSVRSQIDTLRRAGISRACGALVKPFSTGSFDEIIRLNDVALALRDEFPDFYIPGIQVHPHFPDESCREIERCCGGEGVRWVGELVGYIMGYGVEFTTEEALKIMRTAKKYEAVVSIHVSDLDVIDRLVESVPGLKIVLAHPGNGKQEFLDRLGKVAQYPNLHLDTSGSGIDRYGIFRKAIDVAGRGKLLFGTDYPVNNPSVYVYGILLEPLSEEEYTAIFRDNFLRLIQ